MAHLLKALSAGLFMVLLFAVPASADGLAEANSLVDQANAIQSQTRALDAQIGEKIKKVFAIDPADENAADALPMLAEARAALVRMTDNTRSVAALWGQVASLGVSEEATTYAAQQKDIAETSLRYHGVTSDLLTRFQTLYDPGKLGKLSKAELRTLYRELTDLEAQSGELDAQLTEMEQASQRYFDEHDVGQSGEGGRGWAAWIVGLAVASASGVTCGVVARKKNRNIVGWGVFGLFIPIAALLAVFAVRRVELELRFAPLLQPQP
ncbi:MAG: hypothetical protein WC709_05725 [Thermoleophilia bacterium]